MESVGRLRSRAARAVGGRERLKVIAVLAGVLALDYADRAVIGVAAPNIKDAFGVGNAEIGFVASAFAIVSATATVPIGMLTDRWDRSRLLAISVCFWSVAMVFSGAAQTFLWLFVAQMFLGIVTATGGPTVASLTGDLFAHGERGRVLGYIRSGELFGTGFGFVVTGLIASYLSWRYSFWILVVPSAYVTWIAFRMREPGRGVNLEERRPQGSGGGSEQSLAESIVKEEGIDPDPRLVLGGGQEHMSLWEAIRYVLRVRSNVIILIAASIGDFFLSGIRVFIVVFLIDQYGISQGTVVALLPVVGAAAIAGMVMGGRFGDELMRRGVIGGRIWTGIVGYVVVGLVLAPAVLVHELYLALPLFMVGAFALAAPAPSLDAVRLDIISHRVWGRAESVRTVLRTAADAGGPAAFGLLSDVVFGGGHGGLQMAILVTLPLLLLNGLVLAPALRHYPREVAAAARSEDADVRSAA